MNSVSLPFLMTSGPPHAKGGEWSWGEDPDLWIYRDRTIAMLRRYARLSIEVRRLPSLLGREFFRTHVTSYRMSTFEDAVIFVHDVERSLEKLDLFSQDLIAKIVLQEYTQDEAAKQLHCCRRTVGRRYVEAVDHLSHIFLEGGLLRPIEEPGTREENSCQRDEDHENRVRHCEYAR